MCYTRKLKPVEVAPLMQSLKGFIDHVPRAAYSLYGSDSPPGQTFTA